MRKYAGFIIGTLLLVVPTLANAFTLRVQVAGGSADVSSTIKGNNVSTTGPVVKTVTGGTNYFYPTAATTLTLNQKAGYTVTYKLNDVQTTIEADNNNAKTTTLSPVTSAASLEVTYIAPALQDVRITRTAGGLIYAQLPNSTTNANGATGVVKDSKLPVTVQANAGYVIHSIDLGNGQTVGAGQFYPSYPNNTTSSTTFDFLVGSTSTNTITATFDFVPVAGDLSANLLAPLAGYTNSKVTGAAVSTDPLATYSFTVTPNSYTGLVTTGGYFEFVPTAVANYVVTVNVTGSGSPAATDIKSKTVAVSSLVTYQVSQCTSCHSSSTPAIVAAFNQSIHPATCQDCHSVETPHSAAVNSESVKSATFEVISTTRSATIPFRGAVTTIFCVKCHKNGGAARNYTSTHDNRSTICSSCHLTVHNPRPFLGGAIQGKALTFNANPQVPSLLVGAGSTNDHYGITTDGLNLYVADFVSQVIRKVVIATSDVSVLAGPGATSPLGGSATFGNPAGITTDGTNLYVTDRGTHNIRQVVIATGAVSIIAGPGATGTASPTPFASPYGITTDGTYLYVTDYTSIDIKKVTIATGIVNTISITGVSFSAPCGITTDGTNLYVTDQTANTIIRVNASNQGSIIAGSTSGTAGTNDSIAGANATFYTPAGITTDGTYLYVTDFGRTTIRKVAIASPNAVITIANSGFLSPFGVTTDGVNLYVADFGDNSIIKLAPGP